MIGRKKNEWWTILKTYDV